MFCPQLTSIRFFFRFFFLNKCPMKYNWNLKPSIFFWFLLFLLYINFEESVVNMSGKILIYITCTGTCVRRDFFFKLKKDNEFYKLRFHFLLSQLGFKITELLFQIFMKHFITF